MTETVSAAMVLRMRQRRVEVQLPRAEGIRRSAVRRTIEELRAAAGAPGSGPELELRELLTPGLVSRRRGTAGPPANGAG